MNNNIYDEIRKNIDIIDIIGSYLPLKRRGKNYVCLCPFHNDKDPSLYVSQEKQIFTCFSCGHTGNALTFIRDYEKISFRDAAIKACKIAGLKIPSELDSLDKFKTVDKYENLYKLVHDLTNYYSYCLSNTTNKTVLDYVESRHLTKEDIEYFRIGYCPDNGSETIDFLRSKGYKDDEIISCGVGVDIGKGQIVDRLRGRIIFTIMNQDGKEIAFSGRRIIDSLGEKYVNTPDTVLFHKSNVLYNYHNAIKNSRRENYCYIVEGFMDAIALHKAGLTNVVATMGTAFTSEHIRMLTMLKAEIRLLFDSDGPGQAANNNALDALSSTSIPIKIVKPLTEYKDCDECLSKGGKDTLINLVSNTISTCDYKIMYYASTTNFSNHEEVKKFIIDCAKYISKLGLDDLDKNYYANEIAKYSNAPLNLILKELNKKEKIIDNQEFDDSHTYEEVTKTLTKYDLADHQILKMMMNDPLTIFQYTSMKLDLCSKDSRSLANLIIDRQNRGLKVDPASLLDEATPLQAKLIGQIDKEQFPKVDIKELAKIIQEDFYKKLKEDDLKQQINESVNVEEQAKLAQQLIEEKFKKH